MGQRRHEARDVYFTDHSVVCDTHRLHLIVPVRPVSSLSAAAAVHSLIVSRLSVTLLGGLSSLSAP